MIRTLLLLLLVVLLVVWVLRAAARVRATSERDRPWDPWAVLGVPRGASHDEITRAYRERLKEYHPDRVADLGPELREVAHRRTVEIQRAYAELTRA